MDYQRELSKLSRMYRAMPSTEDWLKINLLRKRLGLVLVDKQLAEEKPSMRVIELTNIYEQSKQLRHLQDLNQERQNIGLCALDEQLFPLDETSLSSQRRKELIGELKSTWEIGHHSHRGTFEPGEKNAPSWVMTPEQFTKLTCEHCKEKFQVDGANGVSGGIMILNTEDGDLYYHGYPDNTATGTSCFAKGMKQRYKQRR